MGNNRPVKTKCFISFLESRKCMQVRIKASHYIYKCPKSNRSIVIQGANKEVPFFHIKTNIETLGVSIIEFYDWIDENC